MPLPLRSYIAGQAWLPRGCARGQCGCGSKGTLPGTVQAFAQKPLNPLFYRICSRRPLHLKDLGAPKKTYSDTMRKPLGGCWLAIVCVLLFSQLATAKAKGIRHKIKWNRKALPSTSQVTEAQRMEVQTRPGAFIKQGRKLDIDFGPEGNRYYEANYWQFPDGIHYNGCSEANVTKEKFVTNCINTTQAANREELFPEKQDNRLHQRILWRLIRELCSVKHCDFWLEKGAGLRVTMDQPVMLCLLVFIWFIVK